MISLCYIQNSIICTCMGGELDGIFLAGSLPHEFIILIVTSFICWWLINLSLSLSTTQTAARLAQSFSLGSRPRHSHTHMHSRVIAGSTNAWQFNTAVTVSVVNTIYIRWQYWQYVISVPADFRRHLVGKTPINGFHCNIAKICFVGKLVIMQTFS